MLASAGPHQSNHITPGDRSPEARRSSSEVVARIWERGRDKARSGLAGRARDPKRRVLPPSEIPSVQPPGFPSATGLSIDCGSYAGDNGFNLTTTIVGSMAKRMKRLSAVVIQSATNMYTRTMHLTSPNPDALAKASLGPWKRGAEV